jgi:hypothetical protein
VRIDAPNHRGAVEAISMEIIDQMAAPAAGFP